MNIYLKIYIKTKRYLYIWKTEILHKFKKCFLFII